MANPHHPSVWRVGLYIRLSREDGQDESESVINQRKILLAYLENDFDEPYEIVDIFVDDGLSGTDDSRADFMRMIAKIEGQEINCVVVKALSRAFRNYANQGFYLETYFPQKKVRFVSLGEPRVDTHKNPEVLLGLELPITGVLNDRYAAMTSSAIRRTFQMKRQRGEFIGAFPPYGFLKDPQNKNKLILDPDIVPIKQDMKDWILLEGMSLAGVATRLNALGIPNPSAYKKSKGWKYRSPQTLTNDGLWSAKSIKDVLLNPANIGHMVQGKQRVISYKVHTREQIPPDQWFVAECVIEPTFSLEEFRALETALQQPTRCAQGSTHLFAGFLRCGDCGKAMHRKKSGSRYVYYYCRTHKEKKTCTPHAIQEEALAQAIHASLQVLVRLLPAPKEILDQANKASASALQSARRDKLLKDKSAEITKTQALLDGLYLDWKSDIISQNTFDRISLILQNRLLKQQDSLHLLQADPPSHHVNQAHENFLRHQTLPSLDRAILRQAVQAIYVHENKAITIQYRLTDAIKAAIGDTHD